VVEPRRRAHESPNNEQPRAGAEAPIDPSPEEDSGQDRERELEAARGHSAQPRRSGAWPRRVGPLAAIPPTIPHSAAECTGAMVLLQ
jgi:hypothetical protein